MSKSKAKVIVPAKTDSEHVGFFTNGAGHEFRIRGLSPLLPESIRTSLEKRWEKEHGHLPTPPTYEVIAAGGDKEIHPHDEKSAQTAKEKKAFAEYMVEKNAFEAKYNELMMNAVFLRGVVHEIPNEEEWVSEQNLMGIDVPVDRAERKLLYVKTEVVQSLDDIPGLMTAVMRLSGVVDESKVQEVEATFRSAVEEAKRGEFASGA